MRYQERLPEDIFSHHIESYWNIDLSDEEANQEVEILFPTCTFNIVFLEHETWVRPSLGTNWQLLRPGAYFFGQRSQSLVVKSKKLKMIFGARFKPHAFARVIKSPVYILNDETIALELLFDLKNSTSELIDIILTSSDSEAKYLVMNELMDLMLGNSLAVDETLRAQLNYILDRKGSAKIADLFERFGVSKVTLRKHFINKVGLTPKKVSQIWRMNYLLQLKEENPEERLTSICMEAGFYDQAHFIKEFKLLFGSPPKAYFSNNETLLKYMHHNISKRFSNQYDPR